MRTTTLGPFGEVIRATGPMAKANPIRFSTKYQDDESDLLYYGYRYYKPSTGTWLNRDPKGEDGGLNLYVNVGNNEISRVDPDGRGFVDCAQALSDLGAAEANLAKRLAEAAADINGTGLDAGHKKALQQAMNQVENALDRVVKHCGCVVGAAALIAGAIALLDAAAALLAGLVIAA
ncbi:MAG: RHS repeat-associated core domain-containing protein [Verrucomicrobiota bacterium]